MKNASGPGTFVNYYLITEYIIERWGLISLVVSQYHMIAYITLTAYIAFAVCKDQLRLKQINCEKEWRLLPEIWPEETALSSNPYLRAFLNLIWKVNYAFVCSIFPQKVFCFFLFDH